MDQAGRVVGHIPLLVVKEMVGKTDRSKKSKFLIGIPVPTMAVPEKNGCHFFHFVDPITKSPDPTSGCRLSRHGEQTAMKIH